MDNIQEEFEIINGFINDTFNQIEDYNSNLRNIERFRFFIDKHKYNIKVDTLIDLLEKNDKYRKCMDVIFNKNKKMIIDGKVDILFKNSLLINSIDVYCMLNNIEINNGVDDYILNTKDMDGLDIYYNEIRSYPLLNYEEEQVLIRKAQQGDEDAKDLFISSNLKLVVKIAKMYCNKGLPIQDLIQEGNMGLMIAIDKFDPDRGFRFSTYAYNWIKQSVTRALANYGRTIRYPVYMIDRYNKFLSVKIKLTRELNREPTLDEIAKVLNIPVEKTYDFYIIQSQTASLDSLVGEDSDSELSSFISDPNTNVEDEVIRKTMIEEVNLLLNSGILSNREIEVLKYRFGLDGFERLTLCDIGLKFGVTRERVRQIESRALSKIRRSHEIIKFESYKQKPNERREKIGILNRNSLKHKPIAYQSNKSYISDYKTIYQFFSDYSKEVVDLMINDLNMEDIILLKKIYGDDFNIPYISTISENDNKKYYNDLLPKMKRILKNIHSRTIDPNMRQQEMSDLLSIGLKAKEKNKEKEIEDISKALFQTYEFDLETMNILNKLKNALSEDDYERLKRVIIITKQNEFLKTMNILELTIILLSLGYINGKYYMVDELASFFEVSTDVIKGIVAHSLQQYENDIISIIDDILSKSSKRLSLTKKGR